MTREPPLTILQLVANRWWTGSADPVIHLIRGLRDRGHTVLLALVPGGRFEDKARAARIAPLAGISMEARLLAGDVVRDVVRLRRLAREAAVDVVHCHHSHDHWLGWLCRGPAALVRTFHNSRSVSARWPDRALYGKTNAVLAVSAGVEARCRDVGIARARTHRIDGVVDVARFAGSADAEWLRKELGAGSGPLIGSVARLAADRGHELLIRAFALLVGRHPDARLLLIGKGERREALEGFVRQLGLTGQVLFAGYRDGDLPEVLQALDVFALMAAGSDESCRAALEAMAAGRPVVARAVGALAEAVVHGQTGVVVQHDDPESIADALDSLARDRVRARAMGEAGRRRAEEQYSPARHAERVEAIYREVLIRARRR